MDTQYGVATGARYLESRLADYLDELRELVNIDSGTFDKSGVDQVGAVLREKYAGLGADIHLHAQAERGDNFTATFHGDGPGSVLLIGHLDTVYPLGTAAVRPFTLDGSRAMGPGVADMKSGDLSIVYALRALRDQRWNGFGRLTVLHNSDEEIGSPGSRDLVRREAEQADAVLVLEPGRSNGDIVSARKGIADGRLTVQGRPAHAGVNHAQGRSAVLELAHLVVGLEGLNGTVPGATLNVGAVEAGPRINVVPDRAGAHFEIRAPNGDSLDEIIRRVHEVVARRTVPGTSADLAVSIEHLPMYKTPSSERLVSLARFLAEALGFTVADTATGGASDGNTAASAGRPVLDGLGPIGGNAHSPDEYIDVSSIVPRTALLAGLICGVGTGSW